MIKKLLTVLYSYDKLLYFNEDSSDAMFFCNEMCILSIDLNNINLNDTNYNEEEPQTIIHVRLLAWQSKFEKLKALKKELNEILMLAAWHSRRWWNFCISEDEKKEIEPTFTE